MFMTAVRRRPPSGALIIMAAKEDVRGSNIKSSGMGDRVKQSLYCHPGDSWVTGSHTYLAQVCL